MVTNPNPISVFWRMLDADCPGGRMPFCVTCGTDVSGTSFCVRCGTQVGGAQPAAAAQASPALPPAGKMSPIVWILVGVTEFFVVVGLAVMGGGLFLAHKLTQ